MIFGIILRLIIYGFVLIEITQRYRAHKGLTFRDVLVAILLILLSTFIANHFLPKIDWGELQ